MQFPVLLKKKKLKKKEKNKNFNICKATMDLKSYTHATKDKNICYFGKTNALYL